MKEEHLHPTPNTHRPSPINFQASRTANPMLPRRKNAGFSMMELLVATGIATLVCFIICGVWIQAIWLYDRWNSQTITDMDAALAMQNMIADVREAKGVQPVASDHLRIIPVKEDGSFDRTEPDTANPIDYYLSDSSGVVGRTGTWLWRNPTNNVSRAISRNVESLFFESDKPNRVAITVVTRNNYTRGQARTSLTERIVYLRNY